MYMYIELDFVWSVVELGTTKKKCTAVYHGFQSSTVVCIAVYRKLYIETIWAIWCSTLNVWGLGNSIIFLPLGQP